jgi:hypothetical protein
MYMEITAYVNLLQILRHLSESVIFFLYLFASIFVM